MKGRHSHYTMVFQPVKRKSMKTLKKIREEMTTGAIAGIGAEPPPDKPSNWSEPGLTKKQQRKHVKKKKILRRKLP